MKAKHCLLTHFSARYPKLPPVHSNSLNQLDIHMEGEEIALPIIAIAFDLMSIRLDEFWKIDRYRDAMEVLFSEVETEKESIAGDEIET